MTEPTIRDFHAHIYFDPAELDRAQALAAAVQERFGVAVGHFHQRPGWPAPARVSADDGSDRRFGEVATWLAVNRAGLTIFAHASTGDDKRDHSHNVVWFGPSEALNLSIFD